MDDNTLTAIRIVANACIVSITILAITYIVTSIYGRKRNRKNPVPKDFVEAEEL